ncbi:AAA family ATPase [Thermoclostridium stercorarium]|uniref:AAA family ATPase n=1 Tax=Thermoclostridium stercorarium TaxID=1510 RepID=UPI002249263F|nr:AAA family ATPase [Thermoclostridium stercorarium]UZQ85927.1 AAA family ATPase [Thermoclostridium stercorarium]
MKNLIFINGTMGVGKTATSRELQKLLPNCVFLDGDWCWDMSPFIVNDETKRMVIDNISYLLNNFISCSVYENIIFCWVMHEQSILDDILSRINRHNCVLYKFSLVCTEQALISRITKDIEQGIRTEDVINRSISRLKNYFEMDTEKIDVSKVSAKEAAKIIFRYIKHRP